MPIMGQKVFALAFVLASVACAGERTAVQQAELPGFGPGPQIIRSGSVRLSVRAIAPAFDAVEERARGAGGRVESSSRTEKAATLVLRIPAERLDGFVDALSSVGREEERNLGTSDVTEEVADLEAALNNDRSLRDRLRELSKRASKVEEVLQIEAELNRVQTAIDQKEGRLKRLRSEVSLSRLSVSLHRERVLGPLGYLFKAAGWTIEKLFVLRD